MNGQNNTVLNKMKCSLLNYSLNTFLFTKIVKSDTKIKINPNRKQHKLTLNLKFIRKNLTISSKNMELILSLTL